MSDQTTTKLPPVEFSLVVSTLGRSNQLIRLFESLERQSFARFEVIVVDQNNDDLLADVFARSWSFPVTRLQFPGQRGLSRGRNAGLKAAKGATFIFPDDDCWYPAWFLQHIVETMKKLDADILSGRAADEEGRSINGRYALSLHQINRNNVWISGIEWTMAFKKTAIESVGGFDEGVGIGASTPWQSCEGQDVILRALDKDFRCYFDPTLFGHHAEFDISAMDSSMNSKARAYGRGLGHVLRIHRYGALDSSVWIFRPLARAGLEILKGDTEAFRYGLNVALGRFEGLLGRTYSFTL